MPLVAYFACCSSRSYTQEIASRYFMLSFYALIRYLVLLQSSLKISARKYLFK